MAHIRPWKCRAIVPVNQALNWLSQELVQISQLEMSQLFLLQNAFIYTDPMGHHGTHSMKSYKAADYLSSHQDLSPLSLPDPSSTPPQDSVGPGVPSHTILALIPSQILSGPLAACNRSGPQNQFTQEHGFLRWHLLLLKCCDDY